MTGPWLTFRELQQLPTARTPTPNQRAGILVWDVGFKTTGSPHSHRDAVEIFYFFQGDCRMIVGPDNQVVHSGQFAVIPPEAPHEFVVEGNVPVAMFLIVTPNLVPSHTQPADFAPGAEKIGMKVWDAPPGFRYAFPPFLTCEVRKLEPGQHHDLPEDPGHETVTFVMKGTPYVTAGPMSGTYPTFGELFIPPGQAHRFENRGHDPIELLISKVTDDPGRTCIDTPYRKSALI